jgi:DNA adenine methylase
MTKLKAPFPYFGGKSKIAPTIWQYFGRNVARYIEPFAGSLAVALAAPYPIKKRIFNDANALLINAWRGIQYDPDGVLEAANRPIAELELRAIHAAMMERLPELAPQIEADHTFYDAEIAGWWIWGQSCNIGNQWQRKIFPRSVPILNKFNGINSYRKNGKDAELINLLSEYLTKSFITCGDWSRVVTDAVLFKDSSETNLTAVFLDPPYQDDNRDMGLYGEHDSSDLMGEVIEFCLEYGGAEHLRLALCRYDACPELDAAGWHSIQWETQGGYANQAKNQDNQNRHREHVYFSPHCRIDEQLRMDF